MNYFETALITFVLLIIAFVIGLLFPKKLKILKILFWGIGALLLLYLVIGLPLIWRANKRASEYLTGMYAIDLDNSRYSNADLHKYSTLTMIVKNDNTFTFNQPVPFFPQKSGQWAFWLNGDEENINCCFGQADKTFPVIHNVITDWAFAGPNLIHAKNGDKIVFKHKE